MRGSKAVVLPIALLWSGQALAPSAGPLTNDESSKEAENPVSRQITLPLRYQADLLDGIDMLTKSTFEVDQAIVSSEKSSSSAQQLPGTRYFMVRLGRIVELNILCAQMNRSRCFACEV
jgi:hypothetical protein